MSLKILSIGCTGLALGAALSAGILLSRNTSRERSRQQQLDRVEETLAELSQRITSVPAARVAGTDVRALDARLARIETQLATAREATPAPGTPAATTPPKPPTTDQLEAARRGQELAQRAIQAGRWAETDLLELRRQFAQMDAASRWSIKRQLLRAVNEQKLELDEPGAPF